MGSHDTISVLQLSTHSGLSPDLLLLIISMFQLVDSRNVELDSPFYHYFFPKLFLRQIRSHNDSAIGT